MLQVEMLVSVVEPVTFMKQAPIYQPLLHGVQEQDAHNASFIDSDL
jgi:hypothetical protein